MSQHIKEAINSIERLIMVDPSRKDELDATIWQLFIYLQKAEADESATYDYEVGTKLKWISNENDYTYRVAIVKKNGVLQVKSVEDGMCDTERYMLKKTFFETEAVWRASLPVNSGSITVTEPRISNRALKMLCCTPLTMQTDGGRLEELELRFPGAKMVLTADGEQLEINSMSDEEGSQFRIYCKATDEIHKKFSDFGGRDKPNLMAEWRGLYIDLSHLF